MEHTSFDISGMKEEDRADLGSVVTGLSGVGGISFDGGQIRVEYDPDYTDPHDIATAITSSGYPVKG